MLSLRIKPHKQSIVIHEYFVQGAFSVDSRAAGGADPVAATRQTAPEGFDRSPCPASGAGRHHSDSATPSPQLTGTLPGLRHRHATPARCNGTVAQKLSMRRNARWSRPEADRVKEIVMWNRIKTLLQSIRARLARPASAASVAAGTVAGHALSRLAGARRLLVALAILGAAGYALYSHPPMQTVGRGEIGVRANQLTGDVSEWRDGSVLVHARPARDARVLAARPDLPARADQARGRRGAAAVGRGPVARRRPVGALRARRRQAGRDCRRACPTTSAARSSSRRCRA